MPPTTTAPREPMAAHRAIRTASDLRPGDHLLTLSGIGFGQVRDATAAPVLVTQTQDAESSATSREDPSRMLEVLTSAGPMYSRASAPASAARTQQVTGGTVLLVSRRKSAHASLLSLGVPVQRRTPIEPSTHCPSVTPAEWASAPLVVIDGFLAQPTLRAMWSRGDLRPRDQIVMVADDPDDHRVYARQTTARAAVLAVLPYDAEGLRSLFRAATGAPDPCEPHLDILRPDRTPETGA